MKCVAIITGGVGGEREVSLKSAENIVAILKDTCCVSIFDFPKDTNSFIERRDEIDVVIPMIHGKGGEDGELQGFLETLAIPYLFSGVETHAIAMNKDLAKQVAAALGIRVPHSKTVMHGESVRFERPVVIKPLTGGSSVATAVVKTQIEFNDALHQAIAVSNNVMIEDFIEGDEFTIGVIEDDGRPLALPVIAIRPKSGFFDYASKYNQGTLAEELCPAPINAELAQKLQDLALMVHSKISCRHMSRTDVIVDASGIPWFLEINTIPGMTKTSLVPKAVMAAGKDMGQLFQQWIEKETSN